MTTFSALWSVLAIQDVEGDEEEVEQNFEEKPTFQELPKVCKSTWADCCNEESSDFCEVVKKTKKKGNGTQKTTCIGNLIYVHPSGRWGKVVRQDTRERMYTQNPPLIENGSRVKFVCGENHKGPCAFSLELV
tara:strand:- start:245 stop:643 length:399 start_codon:yes stop_codon:yes gene_type:complete